MDGVIADFDKTKEKLYPNEKRPELKMDFSKLDTIPGAQDALIRLNQDFDIFIASTPVWDRPETWSQKREWISKHFPYLKQKLILTHRKDLLIGDILIDDSRWRGQPDFKGEWYWFNRDWNTRNWKACLEWIYKNKHNNGE